MRSRAGRSGSWRTRRRRRSTSSASSGSARATGAVLLRDLGVSFDHGCFACGDRNDAGLHLALAATRDAVVVRYVASERHQGYDGVMHGGTVTALLDEAMAWATYIHAAMWAMTARLAVTFRGPVPVGEAITVIGRVVRDRGRALETEGRIERAADGAVLAEAEARFLRLPVARRDELARRYGVTEDALARVRDAIGWTRETVGVGR